MNLRTRLSSRIHMTDIHEILIFVDSQNRQQELFDLAFDEDEKISYQTLWVLTHVSKKDSAWLHAEQDKLIDTVLVSKHEGKRRLLLTLINDKPLSEISRVDFLDYCLERMISPQEPVAIQSVCIKIAYQLCKNTPELLSEFRSILDMADSSPLSPALRASRKSVLKDMKKKKDA